MKTKIIMVLILLTVILVPSTFLDAEKKYSSNNNALNILQHYGLGISNEDLARIGEDFFLTENVKGKILLQVEENGEVIYVNSKTGEKVYLEIPKTRIDLLRQISEIEGDDYKQIMLDETETQGAMINSITEKMIVQFEAMRKDIIFLQNKIIELETQKVVSEQLVDKVDNSEIVATETITATNSVSSYSSGNSGGGVGNTGTGNQGNTTPVGNSGGQQGEIEAEIIEDIIVVEEIVEEIIEEIVIEEEITGNITVIENPTYTNDTVIAGADTAQLIASFLITSDFNNTVAINKLLMTLSGDTMYLKNILVYVNGVKLSDLHGMIPSNLDINFNAGDFMISNGDSIVLDIYTYISELLPENVNLQVALNANGLIGTYDLDGDEQNYTAPQSQVMEAQKLIEVSE